jgi:sodium-dependent dicarboxylate transporter 2/3/5
MKIMQAKVDYQTRVIQFMGCILASLLLTYFIGDASFKIHQTYVLFLVFFSIGLWVTEAIPPFAVGIMIIGFLVFFLGQPEVVAVSEINVQTFVNKWADSVIWLLLGGFFLAEGMKKTGLDSDLFNLIISKFSQTPERLLLALMLGTAFASMLMSNTATTAMMIAAITPLIVRIGKENNYAKAILLGVPAAASIGGMGTIIGSPPNAIAVDAINNMSGASTDIGFFEWMIIGAPISIILTIIFWFILIKKFPYSQSNVDIKSLFVVEDNKEDEDKIIDELALYQAKFSKKIVLSVLIVTILLWLTDGLHPIPVAAVSGIPIIALTMTNIITGDDVRQLPWDTLMLVAGGLSLGLALQETGLARYFIEMLQHIDLSLVLLIASFAIITILASNIMSNTAAAAILIPAAEFWQDLDPVLIVLIIGLSASCALFLPVSTPPNAIAFSTGFVQAKDFRLSGISIGIIGPIIIILWCQFILAIL